MIEKIKVQLAQFELGMTGTGSTRVLSDYPSYARRNRARTVASAKLSQYKHTPVREMLMPGRDLPGQAKSSSKAKTLMSLKASMAEQDMVKYVILRDHVPILFHAGCETPQLFPSFTIIH